MNHMVVYNVRSLAGKLSALLSWPMSLFLLSEVRVSTPKQRSLARVLAANDCSCVWGVSPPPSPTFSVSPGGVAIIARKPWTVREYSLPAIEKWRAMSRVCTAIAVHPQVPNVVLVAAYGLSESHHNKDMNEGMLMDIMMSAASLNMPVFVGGDLNTQRGNSQALTMAEAIGLTCVSPSDKFTTMSRDGAPSKSPPIDFLFANEKARDLVIQARVNYGVALSDHYPIEMRFVSVKPDFLEIVWPKKTVICENKTLPTPYPETPTPPTYAQWLKLTTRWIAGACQTKVHSKTKVRIRQYVPKKLKEDQLHAKLVSLSRALSHALRHGINNLRMRSIQRKITSLPGDMRRKLTSIPLHQAYDEVVVYTETHVKQEHARVMTRWKDLTTAWKKATKAACAFVKNPLPVKMTTLKQGECLVSHPYRAQSLMMGYWASIEQWPTLASKDKALEQLEQKYSFLVPRCEYDVEIEPAMLLSAAKNAKDSTMGLDAWTVKEVKLLPLQAWDALLKVLRFEPEAMRRELVSLVKRVPIEKHEGLCSVEEVRPIDLFSVILRVVSSAAYAVARPWTCTVLHPSQYATQGGAIVAASRIALRTELTLLSKIPTCAVTSDFAKMFNSISVDVAEAVAGYMGLGRGILDMLTLPIRIASFSWKLPFGAKPVETVNERGLPQGMAGSAQLAECCIAPLLWRCQAVSMRWQETL